MQIMTAKITTLRTLYVHVVSNRAMIPQILYDIVLYAWHFLPAKFFPQYYFYELCFALPQSSGKVQKNSSVTFISEESPFAIVGNSVSLKLI